MRKKGFFFSMDAFFALILFGMFLAMIYSYYLTSPRLSQQMYVSEDLLDAFSNVRISELDLNQYSRVKGLVDQNVINNTDKTVFEVLSDFSVNNHNVQNTKDLVQDLTLGSSGVIPKQYGFGVEFVKGGTATNIYEDTKEKTNIVVRQRLVPG